MLCGIPGTGKSHLRNTYSPLDWKILSSDDIIEEMCRENSMTYSEGFPKFVKEATKRLNVKIKEYSDSNVIWDQTNLTKKVRASKLSNFPNHEKRAICIIPKMPNEIVKDMMKYRSDKVIPLSIIENMLEGFEFPTTDEGFLSVTFYTTAQIFS